jgi:DNA-directed RNA polymerase subunit RPC12/RpoP
MDNGKHPLLDFTCRDCGKPFKAPQGSKKQLCAECLFKAVAEKLPRNKDK